MLSDVQELGLELQGPRPLSTLELEAVDLAFSGSIDPEAISLRVVESDDISLRVVESEVGLKGVLFGGVRQSLPKRISGYDGDGLIWIKRSAFPYTQALNINSDFEWVDPTVKLRRDRKSTDPFSAGNMHYLSTLIFECAHHWQQVYGEHTDPGDLPNPPHHFNRKELTKLRLFSEQHASAVQIYFLIYWQIVYKVASSIGRDPRWADVDLTSQPPNSPNSVGPVDRYMRILEEFPHINGRRILKDPGTAKKNKDKGVRGVFKDLQSLKLEPQNRKKPFVCAKAMQPAQVDPTSPFYKPRKWSIVDIYEPAWQRRSSAEGG